MNATVNAHTKPFGQILIERGLITESQLQDALKEQKRSPDRKLLGETIVALGYCGEDEIVEAIAEAHGMPYAKLNVNLVDPRVISNLPREFVEKQAVLPLFRVDDVLTVAIAEPSNLFLVEEITQLVDGAVNMVAATTRDIKAMIAAVMPDENVFVIDDILSDAAGIEDSGFPDVSMELGNLEDAGDSSPVIKLANGIIFNAVREGASDIHIEPDDAVLRIRYRIDGQLITKATPPPQMNAPLVSRIKIMASLDISERRLPQDGAIHVKLDGRPVDLRVSTLPNKYGEKVVLRIIDKENVLVPLERLGFANEVLESFREQIGHPHGLFLVTGPTGSGKSTTLYSGLNEINKPNINICTVEDPIEFNLVGVNQFQVNERIGYTFAGTLRSLLRQDPDVIMVGEIRDVETAKIAVQAALTGHMVFSTLHTNDAPSAVTRLYNLGVEPYLVSAGLVGVLAQRLVRKLCPSCSEEADAPALAVRAAERVGRRLERIHVARGCNRCRKTGFSGRIGIFEMLVPDDNLRDSISSGGSLDQIRAIAQKHGMTSLADDGFRKVQQGATTVEEIMRVTAV